MVATGLEEKPSTVDESFVKSSRNMKWHGDLGYLASKCRVRLPRYQSSKGTLPVSWPTRCSYQALQGHGVGAIGRAEDAIGVADALEYIYPHRPCVGGVSGHLAGLRVGIE